MVQKKLYLVVNLGCDAETSGILELNDDERKKFFQFFKNLNRNSTYGCMPKIRLYEISWDDLVEVPQPLIDDIYSKQFVENRDRLYYGDKIYTTKDDNGVFGISLEKEEIIPEKMEV